jgi:hypothetical protein
MMNADPLKIDALQKQLVELLVTNREDLASHYQRVLRDSMFLNRAEVRPSQVKGIATDEVDALLGFLQQPAFSGVERGAQLYQIGLGEQAVMRLGQVTRQFFSLHLENGQVAPMLELVDTYQEAVIQGFIKSLETNIFIEQERTHKALQRASGQG